MYKLTEHDADVMATILFVSTRMAERAVEVMEQYHEEAYMATNDYKLLVKKVGLVQARQYLQETNRRLLRHDEKCRFSEWLEAAKRLHACTERLTIASMDTAVALQNDVTAVQLFDAIQEGAGLLSRLLIMTGNMEEDDIIKLESYAKILNKRHLNDTGLLDYFRPQI